MLDPAAVQGFAGISQSDERRIAYLDTLRGLASIQVLLSHSMLAFFIGTAFASPSSRTLVGYLAASPLFFLFDGASAVCIFFVLSGYVLTPVFTHSRATNGAIIGSRFLRLGIPAIAGCAFSAVLFQVFGGYNETAGPIAKSWWLADGWRPSADLWFLKDALVNGVLLGFQDSSIVQWFGFPAASLASMADSYVTPLWTLSVEFYGSILVLLLARSRSWTLLILATLILGRTYLLCFIAGHVAARFDLGGKRLLMPWPAAAAAAAIGLGICLTSHFWSPEPVVNFCAMVGPVPSPMPVGEAGLLDEGIRSDAVHRCNHAMHADSDIPVKRATACPRPIVLPDLPDPLAHYFRRREFLTRYVGPLGRRAAGAAPGHDHRHCHDASRVQVLRAGRSTRATRLPRLAQVRVIDRELAAV